MSHSKTTWTSSTTFTTTNLNNLEAQYTDGYTDFLAHNHDSSATPFYTKSEMEGGFWWGGNDGAGSYMDADMIYTASGNKHYADLAGSSISAGQIVMWEGSAGTIPSGWAICDGSGGRPDLRDRWVLGAGLSFAVGSTGGYANRSSFTDTVNVASYTLTWADVPNHTHSYNDYMADQVSGAYGGTQYRGVRNLTAGRTMGATGSGGGHGHSGSYITQNAENRPASVALYYIQKV